MGYRYFLRYGSSWTELDSVDLTSARSSNGKTSSLLNLTSPADAVGLGLAALRNTTVSDLEIQVRDTATGRLVTDWRVSAPVYSAAFYSSASGLKETLALDLSTTPSASTPGARQVTVATETASWGWDIAAGSAIAAPPATGFTPPGAPAPREVKWFVWTTTATGGSTDPARAGWSEVDSLGFSFNPGSSIGDIWITKPPDTADTKWSDATYIGAHLMQGKFAGVDAQTGQVVASFAATDIMSAGVSYTEDTSRSVTWSMSPRAGLTLTGADGATVTRDATTLALSFSNASAPGFDAALPSVPVQPPHYRYFMRIDDLAGGPGVTWIELDSFSVGATMPVGSLAAKVNAGDAVFSRHSDVLDGYFWGKGASHIRGVQVEVWDTSSQRQVTEYKFDDVLISSVSQRPTDTGPVQSVTLAYAEISASTFKYDAAGTQSISTFGFSVQKNQKTGGSVDKVNTAAAELQHAQQTPAGVSYFMKVDGVTGGVAGSDYAGWSRVSAVSVNGFFRSSTATNAALGDFSVVKQADASDATLLQMISAGTTSTVTIDAVDSNGLRVERYTLGGTEIRSLAESGSAADGAWTSLGLHYGTLHADLYDGGTRSSSFDVTAGSTPVFSSSLPTTTAAQVPVSRPPAAASSYDYYVRASSATLGPLANAWIPVDYLSFNESRSSGFGTGSVSSLSGSLTMLTHDAGILPFAEGGNRALGDVTVVAWDRAAGQAVQVITLGAATLSSFAPALSPDGSFVTSSIDFAGATASGSGPAAGQLPAVNPLTTALGGTQWLKIPGVSDATSTRQDWIRADAASFAAFSTNGTWKRGDLAFTTHSLLQPQFAQLLDTNTQLPAVLLDATDSQGRLKYEYAFRQATVTGNESSGNATGVVETVKITSTSHLTLGVDWDGIAGSNIPASRTAATPLHLLALATSFTGTAPPLTVTLSVQHGTLQLPTVAGVTYQPGTPRGTAVFSGDVDAIDAVLGGLAYVTDPGYAGFDTLSVAARVSADTTHAVSAALTLRVGTPSAHDISGDGRSDIVWRNVLTGENQLWRGADPASTLVMPGVADLDWRVAAIGDFNGNGKADLLWRNAATGANHLWNDGDAAQTAVLGRVADLNWSIVAVADFNGDGRDDILWRNLATGDDNLWLRPDAASSPQVLPRVADTNWRVAGAGDFAGDGKADILWRNSLTGQNVVWRDADGTAPQALASVGLDWRVAGTGDFDGDGRTDVLWRSASTGANHVWNGGDAAADRALTSVADLNWKVASVGDYDGDGKADILWRNASTGSNVAWFGADSARTVVLASVGDTWRPQDPAAGADTSAPRAAYDLDGDGKSDLVWRNASNGADHVWRSAALASVLGAVADPAWKIVGIADFAGDGKADILWRNEASGANHLWRNGDAASTVVLDAVADANWKPAAVADFNGDGRADILWRNSSTGANHLWSHGDASGLQVLASVPDANWQVAGAGDFNGDGRADILWRNMATGANDMWRGADSASRQALGAVSLDWRVAAVADFNGDGNADILWRNTATGANHVWNSANAADTRVLAPVADLAWKVVAAGDYDGDGKADIVWRHSLSGADTIWYGADSALTAVLAPVGDLDWNVPAQTGAAAESRARKVAFDADGDGKADLVWRNAGTGANDLWSKADGTAPVALAPVADLDWKIVGFADFDGDGKADLLWRNSSSGLDTIWSAARASSARALATVGDLNWKVAATADFDGNGRADILWRNAATGADQLWPDGESAAARVLSAVDSNWRVAGAGDFDGDGKADILWRNIATGANQSWNGANASSVRVLATVADTNWKVAGVGDVDGDGRDDILWRNWATGENHLWQRGDASSTRILATVALDWKVAALADVNGDGRADVLWRNSATGQDVLWPGGDASSSLALTTVADTRWEVKLAGANSLQADGSYLV